MSPTNDSRYCTVSLGPYLLFPYWDGNNNNHDDDDDDDDDGRPNDATAADVRSPSSNIFYSENAITTPNSRPR